MGLAWDAFKVKCPFYRDHGGNRVQCEPLMGEDENEIGSTALFFRDQQRRKCYMAEYCRKGYPQCRLYRALHEFKYRSE